MGLIPEEQITTVVNHWPGSDVFFTGTVHNVVARLKGTASTRAILVDVHSDAANSSVCWLSASVVNA